METAQTKNFIEYPSPKTRKEALEHIKNGGELWGEHLGPCPEHDNEECICCYMGLEEDFEPTYMWEECDSDDLNRMHLVPKNDMEKVVLFG